MSDLSKEVAVILTIICWLRI